MCVYTTQNQKLTTQYSMQRDHLIRKALPLTLFMEDSPKPDSQTPVIGIGNWGIIQFAKGDKAYWKWAKFAPPRSQWRGGKPLPSYNTKTETILAYIEGTKKSAYGTEVLEDLTERPCIFWVNSFFESNGNKNNPRWFHIYREDGQLIPLASYFRPFENKEGEAWDGFTIITRDPYELVEQTGHERSPAILAYSDVENWLKPSGNLMDKIELLADIPDGYYTIDEVERYSVTKRTEKATEPIEGGKEYLKGALAEEYF
jgi:hypothetical protein